MKKTIRKAVDNPFIACAIIVAISYLISTGFSLHTYAVRKSMRSCSSFATWKEAQAFYEADIKAHGYLDRDHDGEACSRLKKK